MRVILLIYVFYERLPLLSQVSTTWQLLVSTVIPKSFFMKVASPIALFAERDVDADLFCQAFSVMLILCDDLVQLALTPGFTVNVPWTVKRQSSEPFLFRRM